MLTKTQIKEEIVQSSLQGKPVRFDMEYLTFPFGFRRMGGEEILMRQLISSKSEEQLQTAPVHEIHKNIEAWCREENIKYEYNFQRDYYLFQKIQQPQSTF